MGGTKLLMSYKLSVERNFSFSVFQTCYHSEKGCAERGVSIDNGHSCRRAGKTSKIISAKTTSEDQG